VRGGKFEILNRNPYFLLHIRNLWLKPHTICLKHFSRFMIDGAVIDEIQFLRFLLLRTHAYDSAIN